MNAVALAGALIAAAYALVSGRLRRTPLFFEIVSYGLAAYALGVFYAFLRESAASADFAPGDSTIQYLGIAGAFFFFLSSYYGAMDSLADEGGSAMRPRRIAAGIAAAALLAAGGWWLAAFRGDLAAALAMIPVAATMYFAVKHLAMPDVEMGFIRVLRPYNAAMIGLCLVQPFALASLGGVAGAVATVVDAALIVILPVLARKGVDTWSI